MNPQITEIVILVVLGMWIAITMRAIATADYQGLQIVTPIFGGVVTALFAGGMIRRRNGK